MNSVCYYFIIEILSYFVGLGGKATFFLFFRKNYPAV